MFSKILVANRGEIAIRAFRAIYELGIASVAVFPYEDRNSLHRQKADEAYQIGARGHPVRAYLEVAEIIRAALAAGADAVYPGYGFLSENPQLAQACVDAGITFVGPGAAVLELAGNKARAIAAAREAGLPVLASSRPSRDVDQLIEDAQRVGFPVFVKAVAGGGGRGMRRVDDPASLPDALAIAMREAESAFGDPTMFLERAVIEPRHIEVQILADATAASGNPAGTIHLYERDCSVQRRHQKVIEVAPAVGLDPDVRGRICADAVAFARHIGYVNAGTVEFLLAGTGNQARHLFIEMNPRIQVEHTVTEEITDVDLVASQIRIAAGQTLADLGLQQQDINIRGAALQCRITTEDPANGFRPDTGKIITYRSAGGAGVRVDGGTVHSGAEVNAHFDSLLVKLTCRGRDWTQAVARAHRALAEFRVRGLSTNIPFLRAVLEDPDFAAGGVSTSFIETHPQLLTARRSADRGTRLLTYLAEVTVNRPHGTRPGSLIDPAEKLPSFDVGARPPEGSRQLLADLGPDGFARWLRTSTELRVTDTTFRDAHQSLLATRVRTKDLATVAPAVARLTPQLLSIEAWGGATYDVALRFLAEDPWERLAVLREAVPNIALQMLLRGRNTVGYTPYPPAVTDVFVTEAARTGVDIFRIFDALNDIDQMRPAIDAVRTTGAVAEVALCYTGDLSDPNETLYTLDYYLRLADSIVRAGAQVLAIKDMAGLLRAPAAHRLVGALRERFDLPAHLHTHDTAGGQLATYLAASAAGVDAVDVASAPMAGTTSQPPMSALVAATDHTDRPTGLTLKAVEDLEPYWEAVRALYAPFESGLRAPTGRVYRHEIPGGQLSNLRQQAIALGLGGRFEAVESVYAAADAMLGRLVKVTPSSKVVGDLALHLVGARVNPTEFEADPGRFDIPDSVIGFLLGELGDPPGGWPEPFRTKALRGRKHTRPTVELLPEDAAELARAPRPTLNRLLFPGPDKEFRTSRQNYGDLTVLPTIDYLYGLRHGGEHLIELSSGVQLYLGLEATGEPDERGLRTVVTTVNGQLRPIQVRDLRVDVDVPTAERADPGNPDHVASPFSGVVTLAVGDGDQVEPGATVATIEAMKMEASITAPRAGVVRRTAINAVQQVEGGDLLLLLTAPSAASAAPSADRD
ncbi:MAG TPA: pyruvate carboxylase [Nakamurella sp.]|nr:pyruvate carboxylase [Nakamurella sp.]